MKRGASQNINAVEIRGIGKLQIALTEGLLNVYSRLGRPEADIKSPLFWIMMDNIIQVWHKVFPFEAREFQETVSEQRETERSMSETLKLNNGFKQTYAIPANMYRLIKVFYPSLSITNKDFIHQVTNRYPFLKTTNNKT